MEQYTYRIPSLPILLLLRSIRRTRKLTAIDFAVPNGYECFNGELILCVDKTKNMCVAMKKKSHEVSIIYTKYYEDLDFILESKMQDTLAEDFWAHLLSERRLFIFEESTFENTKHIIVQPENLYMIGHDININITIIRGKIFYMLNEICSTGSCRGGGVGIDGVGIDGVGVGVGAGVDDGVDDVMDDRVEIFKHIPRGSIEVINNNTILKMDMNHNVMLIHSYMVDIVFGADQIAVNGSNIYVRELIR